MAERHAAEELRHYLQAVTGGDIPFIEEDVSADPAALQIEISGGDIDSEGYDAIRIECDGRTLVLAGAGPRAALFAVYTFLSEYGGVRWWNALEETVPFRPDWVLEEFSRRYRPAFRIRDLYYTDVCGSPQFASRMRLNGQYADLPTEYGGSIYGLGGGHTYWQLLPPAEYFEEHPEWYALENGVRTVPASLVMTELCLTNMEMRAELIRKAGQWLRESPNRQISISQGDSFDYCQCDQCRDFVARHGTPADLVLDMVNQAADELRLEFPDVLVDTFAYQYSRPAPRSIMPRDNVIIRLSSINANFGQPLAAPANAVRFGDDLRDWGRIAHHIGVWNYTANYPNSVLPLPNIVPLAEDLRFFAANGVDWAFEQAESWTGYAGELAELRCWLQAQLLWDPDRDQEALIDEFLYGFYGADAAPFIRRYIDLLQEELARHPEVDLHCYRRGAHEDWLPFSKVLEARELMISALDKVAGDPVLAPRVRRAGIGIDFLLLARPEISPVGRVLAPGDVPAPELDYLDILEVALADAQAAGLKTFGEMGNDAFVEQLHRNIAPPESDIPEFCRGLPAGSYVIIPRADLTVEDLGVRVFAVDDPSASSGKVWRMPATHTGWNVYYRVPRVTGNGKWLPYVEMRCSAGTAVSGDAMQFGFYDGSGGHAMIPAEAAATGGYHWFPMFPVTLKTGMTLYCAPVINPAVTDIFIDRMILVRVD